MNSSLYSIAQDNVPILYFDELTPQARSCIMLIHMLKIPVEMRYIDLFNGAHLKEDYAAINPLRTVPALVHGDLTLFDGHTILMYLCENFGGVKCKHLFPENVALRYDIVSKLFFESNILYRRHSEFLTELLRKTATYADIEFYEKKILGSYDILENLLKNSNYLCSNWLTLADISCVTTVSALHLMFPIEESRWPRVYNWFRNIRLRPEYKCNLSGIEKQRELMKTVGHFDIRDKNVPNIQTLQNQYIYSDYDLAAPIVMAAIQHQLPSLPIDAFVDNVKPKVEENATSTSLNQTIKEESDEKLKKVNNKKTTSKASLKTIKKPQTKSKEKLKTVFEIEKEMFKELEDNLQQKTGQLQEVQSTAKNVHEIKSSMSKQKPEQNKSIEEKIESKNAIEKIVELFEKSNEKEDEKAAEKGHEKTAEKGNEKTVEKGHEKTAEKGYEKAAEKGNEKTVEKEHEKEIDKELEQQRDVESEQTLTSSQYFQRKFGHNVIKKSAREYFTKHERHSEEDSKYTLTDKIVENKVKLKNLKKSNPSTQSNIWSNKTKTLYTSTSKDNLNLSIDKTNLSKDKTNLSKDKTNLSKDKTNLSKVKSNLTKVKSNLSKDKSNLSKVRSNLSKVNSNLSKVKSNLSKVKSNLSKETSNFSKETSNLSKDTSNLSKDTSKQTSNLSKDTLNLSKETSNLSTETSNLSTETSNLSKTTSLVSGKSTSIGESSLFFEKASNAAVLNNEKVVKTVSLKEEILNSIKSFEEKTKPLKAVSEVNTLTVTLSKVISDAALNTIKSSFYVKEFKSKESNKTPISVTKETDVTEMKTSDGETSKMELSSVNKRYIKPIKTDEARILLSTVNSDVSDRFLKDMIYANRLQKGNSLQKVEREVLARPEVINEIIENVDKKKVIPTTTSKTISSKTISPITQKLSTPNLNSATNPINSILEIKKEEQQLEKLINEKTIIKMKNKWLSQTFNKSKVSLVNKLSSVDAIHFSKPKENELKTSNQLNETDKNSIDDIFRVSPNTSSTSAEKFNKNYDTQLNKTEKLDTQQEIDKDKDLPSTSKKYIDKLERDVEQKIFSTYCLPGISQNLMENYPMKCGLKNIGLLGKNINRESKDTENNYGIFIVDENSDIELQANGNVYSLKLSGAKVKNAPKSLQSILSRPRPIKRSSVIKPKTNKHSKKSTEDDNEAHGSTSKKSLLSSLSRKNRATYKKVSFQTKKPKTKLKSKKTTESSKRDSDA